MQINFLKVTIGIAVAITLFGFAPLNAAQDKPADNMQILRDKIKADKKLVVASNMELTESEAKSFWPIYDEYQKELQKINQRMVNLVDSYADDRAQQVADRRQGEKADRRGQRDRAGGGQSQKHLRAEAQQSAADHQSRAISAN